MATKEALQQVLRAVAMGDEAATEALAQFLEQPVPTQANAAEIEAQLQARFARERAADKADLLSLAKQRARYPDVFNNPDYMELGLKIEQQIGERDAKAGRTRSPAERRELALKEVMRRKGDPAEADAHDAIAAMKNGRQPAEQRHTETDSSVYLDEDNPNAEFEAEEAAGLEDYFAMRAGQKAAMIEATGGGDISPEERQRQKARAINLARINRFPR
jgi:hypothetical protein